MKQRAIKGAAVLDNNGKVLAVAGTPEGPWDGKEATRTPLPGGGLLVSLPEAPSADWPRFARAFVHEARSPLNALGIYLELLGTRVSQGETKPGGAVERALTKAQEQVRRLDELLRIFSDLWAPRGEVADLAAVARAAARFSEHEAIRRGLRFSKEICEAATVPLSPPRLAEAFVAALAGALRAKPESTVSMDVRIVDRLAVIAIDVSGGGEAPPQDERLLDAGAQAFRELGGEVTSTATSLRVQLETCAPVEVEPAAVAVRNG